MLLMVRMASSRRVLASAKLPRRNSDNAVRYSHRTRSFLGTAAGPVSAAPVCFGGVVAHPPAKSSAAHRMEIALVTLAVGGVFEALFLHVGGVFPNNFT